MKKPICPNERTPELPTKTYSATTIAAKINALVNSIAAPQFGYPLSLFTYDESLRKKLNDALYVATEDHSGENKTLTFEYSDSDVSVKKKFTT